MSTDMTSLRTSNPQMVVFLTYLTLLGVNAAVIYLAHLLFPTMVVLGTVSLTVGWAVALAASKLALINTFALPWLTQWELSRKKELSPAEMIGVYLVINFLGLWAISRFADVFGLGLSSWLVVLVLAAVLDVIQGAAMMTLEKILRRG